ncbi:MAG TPA: hypothetical protein VFO52_08175, partial [Longimicrobiales bacterium]|nr:hypothetical protein [Longimicrobiales bacterium]
MSKRAKASAGWLLLLVLLGVTPAFAQDWRTITSLRQFKGEQQLRVEVEYGAGNLSIGPAIGNSLYRATLRYDANAFKPLSHYSDGRLRVGLEGGSIKGRNMKSG